MLGYDVIGDIHGQAGKLVALLRKLGYTLADGTWRPPAGRQAVFIGDLIDRGPEQVEVLRIVRSMVDAGHARVVMGNHEWNAIGYATPDREKPGEFLRRRSAKNQAQHAEFLKQVGQDSGLHRELIDWFKTLPPTLDLEQIRLVHAWWHQPFVDQMAVWLPDGVVMDEDFLHKAFTRGLPEWEAMEGLTKGHEISLPHGHSFIDHSGAERREVRTRWWLDRPRTYRDVALVGDQQHRVPDLPLPTDYAARPVEGSPIFIGHYWMSGRPEPQSPKVACVDYSAAHQGPLVAYRWDGESHLDPRNFIAAGGAGQ